MAWPSCCVVSCRVCVTAQAAKKIRKKRTARPKKEMIDFRGLDINAQELTQRVWPPPHSSVCVWLSQWSR